MRPIAAGAKSEAERARACRHRDQAARNLERARGIEARARAARAAETEPAAWFAKGLAASETTRAREAAEAALAGAEARVAEDRAARPAAPAKGKRR
jgi:hypothetical protein